MPAVLADIIARTDQDRFVLVGHSLGARVVATAAEAHATVPGAGRRIESMHLLGAAAVTEGDWQNLNAAVDEKVWNYWSRNDAVLKWLYRTGQCGQRAVGHEGFGSTFAKISDRNVSRQVASHSEYIKNVKLQ